SVARDFVEAPSQMLENWVWDSDILNMISRHYKNRSERLPEILRAQMLAAKDFNLVHFYTRRLMLCSYAMTLHTSQDEIDVTATYDRLYQEIIGIESIEGGHFPAGFGHLMGGYDAGYYGYIWSEVYAADMFSKFEERGLLNAEL